jgi:hypothetical protein
MELPFTDFQGFLKDGTYKLGAEYGSAHEGYLKVRYIYIITNACRMSVNIFRVKSYAWMAIGRR